MSAQTTASVTPITSTPNAPTFEGAPVQETRMKISGRSDIEDSDGVVISTDDRVRLVGEYRVTGVRHYVDEKTGNLVREQVLKPLSIQLCPWDPSDPTDGGIVRARP
jgi:hypothetical protein